MKDRPGHVRGHATDNVIGNARAHLVPGRRGYRHHPLSEREHRPRPCARRPDRRVPRPVRRRHQEQHHLRGPRQGRDDPRCPPLDGRNGDADGSASNVPDKATGTTSLIKDGPNSYDRVPASHRVPTASRTRWVNRVPRPRLYRGRGRGPTSDQQTASNRVPRPTTASEPSSATSNPRGRGTPSAASTPTSTSFPSAATTHGPL